MKKLMSLLAIAGILCLESCMTAGQGSENAQTLNWELGGSWTLISIDEASGTNINEGFPDKKPTLTLEAISKKLTGNTGCNQMFGSFSTHQNKINFFGLGSTKMYCAGVKEAEYFATLQKVASYSIQGNQLIFFDSTGKEILKYTK